MTVHDWLESFELGEERKIPKNTTWLELSYYAEVRFGYKLVRISVDKIKRVCPHCGR